MVGNRSWERRLATGVGNIRRGKKKKGNKEQGLKSRGWEQGLKEDYKD